MGANHRKRRSNLIRLHNQIRLCIKDTIRNESGDAVVEATILFPVMTMVFAALVMLSLYLPSGAVLQRATQYAAYAIATEISDTWLFYDESSMQYYHQNNKNRLKNVYAGLFMAQYDVQSKGEDIVTRLEGQSISSKAGTLTVECSFNSNLLYKEVVVTASREYPMPVDLSFIGFPTVITVTASSKAAVQNADEFIRSMDMAIDFAEFISSNFGLNDVGNTISSFGSRTKTILGW